MALGIMKDILDLHRRPEDIDDIDREIQHMRYHLDTLVRQGPVTPPTIIGLGKSLGFFANVDAGHQNPHENNRGPTSERGIILATARALQKGQVEAEAKIHAIEKQLGVTRTVFLSIQSWDSLHPGISTEEAMRDILHDYPKGYVGRALDDSNPNPYERCTDLEVLSTEKSWKSTERLVEVQWRMFGLAPDQQAVTLSRPSYGTLGRPQKRLMEVVLELAEEHHAQQLSALRKAFDLLDFLDIPHPLLQAEPPLNEDRCVHSTAGHVWELLYDLRTDAFRVELVHQEYGQAFHETIIWVNESEGKKALPEIGTKYELPNDGEFFSRFDRGATKELMMAYRKTKKNDGTREPTMA
jgi:hypothetical protein